MKLKDTITFPEGIAFINEVIHTVFTMNSKTGQVSYTDELYHYALGLAIAKYYGNYTLTNDMEKDYQAAIAALKENNTDYSVQRTYLIQAINEKIKEKKSEIAGQNITVVSNFDVLISPLRKCLISLKEKIEQFNTDEIKSLLSNE